jgi:hypothetical protein
MFMFLFHSDASVGLQAELLMEICKYSSRGLLGGKDEEINLTRIYFIFIGLLFIVSTAPDMAGSDSGRDTKETGFAHVPVEAIASEFRKVRKIKGHFDGGAWNDAVDHWMGRKHRLMIELGSRLSESKYKKDDIITQLGQPDRIAGKGDDLFKRIIRQQRYESSAADSYLILPRGQMKATPGKRKTTRRTATT